MEMRGGERFTARLRLVVPDDRGALARVRAALEAVSTTSGLGHDETFALKVAANEAVANALAHAAAGGAGVDVTVVSEPDAVEVEVFDRGRFVMSDGLDSSRGRGLPLIVALADEVEFATMPAGTRVRIRKRAGRDPERRAA